MNDGAAFTAESIAPVRDFTTRKTLTAALTAITSGTMSREAADLLAVECLGLIECMRDRDAKAAVFHNAVKQAGNVERLIWEGLVEMGAIKSCARCGS